MGGDHADLELAGLVEQLLDALVEIVLGLVDVEEGGAAAVGRDRGALLDRLDDQGEEEAAEDLAAVLLEELLGVSAATYCSYPFTISAPRSPTVVRPS